MGNRTISKKKKTALFFLHSFVRLLFSFLRSIVMSAIAVRASAVRPVASRSAVSKIGAAPRVAPRVALSLPLRRSISSSKKSTPSAIVAATPSFDELLAKGAEAFEKSDNKVAVAGWASAASFVYFHLLIIAGKGILGSFFVGFPLEALGAAVLPLVVTRYVLDKKSWYEDAEELVKDVSKRLPGL